jgi:hypothetical protein
MISSEFLKQIIEIEKELYLLFPIYEKPEIKLLVQLRKFRLNKAKVHKIKKL